MSPFHTVTIPAVFSAILLAACVVVDPGDDGAGESSSDSGVEGTTAEPPMTSSSSSSGSEGDSSSSGGSEGGSEDGSASSGGSEGGSSEGGSSDTGEPDAVCDAIVGTSFLSIEELECGLTPMGVELCHWQLVFEDDGEYLWMHSDVGEGGTYTCEGGVISTDLPHDVAYDVATGILTWDGVEYVAEPV